MTGDIRGNVTLGPFSVVGLRIAISSCQSLKYYPTSESCNYYSDGHTGAAWGQNMLNINWLINEDAICMDKSFV